MADTFTTNYNLTKPEVGASADTWGAKLNLNLDALDFALKGVSDVANGAQSGVATLDSQVVKLTGDQTIAGAKTFSGALQLGASLAFSTDNFAYSFSGGTFGQVRAGIRFDGTDRNVQLWTNEQQQFVLNASGNAGFGTPTPNARVSVSGAISLVANLSAPSVDAAIYRPADGTVGVIANGAERVRVGPAGQIGLGGANYGASGQVLTSGGAGAAPTWQTISTSPTTAQVLAATAGASAGAVGTYAFGQSTGYLTPGQTRAGSSIQYSAITAESTSAGFGSTAGSQAALGFNGALSGTWRCMGGVNNFSINGNNTSATLWLRIS
jgi:hypothetical protein